MHILEKQAWFMLIVATATLVLLLIMIAIFGLHPAVFGAFGLFGFAGFAPLIGHRQRKAGMVVMDERDKQIALNATTGGYSVFWLLFIATIMGPFFVLGPTATVTLQTSTICFLGFPAFVILMVVRSLIVVVLYRRGGHE